MYNNFKLNQIREIIFILTRLFQEVAGKWLDEEEMYKVYSELFGDEGVIILMYELSDFIFQDVEQEKLRVALLFYYETAVTECGLTAFSQMRAVDSYNLFGHKLSQLNGLIN